VAGRSDMYLLDPPTHLRGTVPASEGILSSEKGTIPLIESCTNFEGLEGVGQVHFFITA
jgi:hypothetical protein